MLQTEHDVKASLMEDDQKILLEQFDDALGEEFTEVQDIEQDQAEDTNVITSNVVDDEGKETENLDIGIPVDSQVITTDRPDEISVDVTLKVAIDDENIIPLKPSQEIVENIENDSNKIEAATTESTVVEEAAA